MTANESSSLCNITLEDGDLKKLDELDPFQTDGYQTVAKIALTTSIVYTSETDLKSGIDVDTLVLFCKEMGFRMVLHRNVTIDKKSSTRGQCYKTFFFPTLCPGK